MMVVSVYHFPMDPDSSHCLYLWYESQPNVGRYLCMGCQRRDAAKNSWS